MRGPNLVRSSDTRVNVWMAVTPRILQTAGNWRRACSSTQRVGCNMVAEKAVVAGRRLEPKVALRGTAAAHTAVTEIHVYGNRTWTAYFSTTYLNLPVADLH